ncbi:MAG: ISL3 family transposase, partial [Candidatus Hadarchaeum sp.]|uniref:ISL3 family transposase n=1 Tax=Candidatus Hadarchaeum sp. TaxID=2883567 RepID=UPI003D141A1B
MVKQEYIDQLVGVQGYTVVALHFGEGRASEEKELVVEIERLEARYRCRCGAEFKTYYDRTTRIVRDLPYGPYKRSWLCFHQVRVDCPRCGVVTEELSFCSPHATYTKRLAAEVALSCREIRSLKAIAEQYGLDWKTVKEIDKRALSEELPTPDKTPAKLLAVDEFSVKKRHRYATTVIDAEAPCVLWVGKDRKQETLEEFFSLFGEESCSGVLACCMDMWDPYEAAVRKHCPQAEIVYDPFHIISAYGREVVDKVRVEESKKARGRHKDAYRGTRYILLSNHENLKDWQQEKLSELLALNKRLFTVYLLKDDLKRLWQYRSPYHAERFFRGWYLRAIYSKIEPLKKFARMLKRRLPGILAHCRYPLHTSVLEGINNKIKVIKRVAYGYRDEEYFFLKIRGAFRLATHNSCRRAIKFKPVRQKTCACPGQDERVVPFLFLFFFFFFSNLKAPAKTIQHRPPLDRRGFVHGLRTMRT